MRALPALAAMALTLPAAWTGPARAAPAAMQVASPAFAAGAFIPRRYQDVSPPLRWTAVAGARAYAVTMDDPDAPSARPFVHWLVWNIPGTDSSLAEGAVPAGSVEGRNGAGRTGYFGPHPPAGAHHYHIRVYALAAPLGLAAGADMTALEAAMRGHVLASGELVGIFAR